MLDIKRLLESPEDAKALLLSREPDLDVDAVLNLATERKLAAQRFDDLRGQQKRLSQGFGKASGLSPEEMAARRVELKELSTEVKGLEQRRKELTEQLTEQLMTLPNIPAADVPVGRSEDDNVVVRTWGEPREPAFDAKEHHTLGEALGILDFEGASKISVAGNDQINAATIAPDASEGQLAGCAK